MLGLPPMEIKEHLNLEHTIVLKQSRAYVHVNCKKANLFKRKVYHFFVIMKKQTSTTHKNNSSNKK